VTTYTYESIAVYTALGGALRLATGARAFTTDPTTGAPVDATQGARVAPYVDADAAGDVSFTAESWPVRLTNGATYEDVWPIDASVAGLATDEIMATKVADPASLTQAAGNAVWVARGVNILDDGTTAHAAFFGLGNSTRLMSNGGNTGLGYFVFKDGAYTGLASVAVGSTAGMRATTGNNLTFVGYQAGAAVTTGNEVTYVGSYTGFQNSGFDNTGIGSRALCGPNNNIPAATGTGNTAVGREALATLSTGINNTAVGVMAGGGQGPQIPVTGVTYSGTTVTVTLGDASGLVVGSTIFFGGITGFTTNNPNGFYVITGIAGNQVTVTVTSPPTGTYGSGGIALGGALSGNNNVSMGYQAAFNNQRGSSNIAVGNYALQAADIGNHNIGVGHAALQYVTNATSNIAIGSSAGFGVTTGNQNTFLGYWAGLTATIANKTTTASGQTVIGYQAGQGSTFQGVHIVAVGSSALASGHYATSVGHLANADGSGAVAIGCDSSGTGASAAAANSFVLGTANHRYKMPGLPTTNPGAGTGVLWNNGGVVTVA